MEQWIKKQNFSMLPIDFDELEFLLSELVEEVIDPQVIDKGKPLQLTFSVRFNENGDLQIESFGNKYVPIPKRPFKQENLSDISVEQNDVVLTLAVPGVKEQDLRLKVLQNKLIVFSVVQNNFRKEFLLTSGVEPKIVKSTFKNGILEVTLKKEKN